MDGEIKGSEAWRFIVGYTENSLNPPRRHCISVNEICGKRRIQGFNSYGKYDPLPMLSLDQPDVVIFEVTVEYCKLFGEVRHSDANSADTTLTTFGAYINEDPSL